MPELQNSISLNIQIRTGAKSTGETGFISYARSCISRMQEEGKYDAAHKLGSYLGRFIAYLGKNEISFRDFDSVLMRNYHTWLENRELGRNSISLYIRNLKRVYRLAVEEGVAKENHPFDGVDVSYRVKKEKTGLTLEEVRRIKELDLKNQSKAVNFARDMFLFSVYARGMTADDMFHLRRENIKDGNLVYTSKITGRKETILWEPLLEKIADKYSRPDTPFLFPVITSEDPKEQWHQHCAALHNINRNLKTVARLSEIPCPLNMTVAHHTWKSMTKGLTIGNLL